MSVTPSAFVELSALASGEIPTITRITLSLGVSLAVSPSIFFDLSSLLMNGLRCGLQSLNAEIVFASLIGLPDGSTYFTYSSSDLLNQQPFNLQTYCSTDDFAAETSNRTLRVLGGVSTSSRLYFNVTIPVSASVADIQAYADRLAAMILAGLQSAFASVYSEGGSQSFSSLSALSPLASGLLQFVQSVFNATDGNGISAGSLNSTRSVPLNVTLDSVSSMRSVSQKSSVVRHSSKASKGTNIPFIAGVTAGVVAVAVAAVFYALYRRSRTASKPLSAIPNKKNAMHSPPTGSSKHSALTGSQSAPMRTPVEKKTSNDRNRNDDITSKAMDPNQKALHAGSFLVNNPLSAGRSIKPSDPALPSSELPRRDYTPLPFKT
jgi:hypothetical protein